MKLSTIRDFIRPLQPAAMLAFLLIAASVSGIMEAVSPGLGVRFTTGLAGMLSAIPTEFYALFGILGTGYTVARTVDKRSKE